MECISIVNDVQVSTEKTLQISESKYCTLMEQSLQAVTIIQNGRIVYSNSAAEELLGYTKEELSAISQADFVTLIHPEDQALVISRIQDRLKGKAVPSRYECRLVTKNGETRWVDLFSTPVEFNGQQSTQTTFIDITERKQAQQGLVELKEFYQDVLDSIINGVWVTDENDTISYANKGMGIIAGISPEEIVGNRVLIDFSEKTLKYFRQHFLKAKKTLKPVHYKNVPVVTPADRLSYQSGWLIPRKRDNLYNGMICSVDDVTDRKQAEIKMQKSEEKFIKAFYSSPSLMAITRMEDGLIIDVNQSFMRTLGYDRDELIGHSTLDLNIWVKQEERKKITKSLQDNKRVQNIEVQARTKSGEKRVVLFSGEIIDLEDNKPYLITIASDITERLRAQEELLKVLTDVSEQKKLRQTQERFVATTSHELITPVTVIKGYIDFLQKYPKQPSQRVEQIYHSLDRNIHRLLLLINNVHSLSKINQDVFSISLSQTDLNEFVRAFQDQCFVLYPSRPILISFRNNGNHDKVHLDQDRILQVLHNLVNNAVKNSPPTSVIEITLIKHASELQISVQDYGAGISHQNFFKLFSPFTHFHTQYSVTGTGLGLYIVKNIIFAHGGSIEVLSQEQFGSSFTIKLPI
ncbi:MAG: PAS domain-containing sensor histidine kinase [Candidatus Hodarchaeales archaeon]